MAAAQVPSLDSTRYEDLAHEVPRNASSIARRSISIFSRRGTEARESRHRVIAQVVMTSPRQITEKPKSWIERRRSAYSGSAPRSGSGSKPKSAQKSAGTILNAVPPSKTIQMTSLEKEMATSPNEEILSAVSEQPPSQMAWTANPRQASPIESRHPKDKSTPLPLQRSKSEKTREVNTRIGLWVNGVAQWDDGHCAHPTILEEPPIEDQTGFTPVRTSVGALKAEKPLLSVTIPSSETKIYDKTRVQPHPRRSVVSIPTSSFVSRHNITPSITVEEAIAIVSPLQSDPPTPTLTPHLTADVRHDAAAPARKESSSTSGCSSSSSSIVDNGEDSASSKRSSATSLEVVPALTRKSSKRLSGRILSRSSLPEDLAHSRASSTADVQKPLPPSPILAPTRAAHVPATSISGERPPARAQKSSSMQSAPVGGTRLRSPELRVSPQWLRRLDQLDGDFVEQSPYASHVSEVTSPSLNQAEKDLTAHLSKIEEGKRGIVDFDDDASRLIESSAVGSIKRNNSVRSVMQPPERTPTLPKRSRKREWKTSNRAAQVARVQALERRKSDSRLEDQASEVEQKPLLDGPSLPGRTSSMRSNKAPSGQLFAHLRSASDEKMAVEPEHALPGFGIYEKQPTIINIEDRLEVVTDPAILIQSADEIAAFTEEALLHILSALSTPRDLSNLAMINKGMYRVYKENEMQLLRTVMFNQSPAAWEFRDWNPPSEVSSSQGLLELEQTPRSYATAYRDDSAVIESLKAMILEHCQTFIRRETVSALSKPSHPSASRFNDAFWRIWCFCKIFGCGKAREDDVTGQLDWLKGGILANNQGCVATVNTNLDFDIGSVLLNPPDCFAKGNEGGLSAQQLYDMTEIWSCLTALLQGYQGRTEDMWEAGVFKYCDVVRGNVGKEERLSEEWTCHLLTLGLDVTLAMAEYAYDSSPTGFKLAASRGWVDWSPPLYGGSRVTFLKEPLARLYEERVAIAALNMRLPLEQEKKEMGRQRVATLAADIRLSRQSSSYRRSSYIGTCTEQPMSPLECHDSSRSNRSSHRKNSQCSVRHASSTPCTPAPNFSRTHLGSPPPWCPRNISPIIEDRVETFNRISLQSFAGVADGTSDVAVQKIVDMGFTAKQAKQALRMTDMGDGLRVDRAVDLLLRQP
ncbi:hypothetical protein B0A50_04364 [Salinomyces thailandicus]|uniref:UBA domain-containing protein n=1 Tax=Salinomyces thailandicus TaxID=706561 RepID=A0A4U0TYS1_9PEZI|nr:hypothetical protein B0A50_04364 [Salinomyces thailandica]